MSVLEAIVGPVSKLLDKIIPDPQARDRAKLELLKLQAGILSTMKRPEEAIAIYKRVIAMAEPGDEEPHIFAASLYLQQNDLASARGVLQGLLKNAPNSFFANYYLARIEEAHP